MKKTVAERKISHLAKVKLLKAELAFEPGLPNKSQLMLLLLHGSAGHLAKGNRTWYFSS